MIRINLLKAFAASGGGDGLASFSAVSERDQVLIDAGKRLLVVLIGPLAMYFYELYDIPQLEAELAKTQTELSETTTFNQSKSGLAAEIKKYEEEQTKINAQMNFINKIARDKINEYKLFQHLQNATPESVWINRLEFRDNELSINVESDVSDELNKFSTNLSNAEFLTNIIPLDQSVKMDPYGVGVNTTTQNLKAKFNSESSAK